MKKLLLLLVGVIVAFAANAAAYLNVPGQHNGWADNGTEIGSDGIGTSKVFLGKPGDDGTLGFKIKVWDGSDHWYSNGLALELGKTYKIEGNSDNNMTLKGADANKEYLVTWNNNTKELTITDPDAKPETKSYVYAIHGQIADANNWNPVELTGTGSTRTLVYDFGENATSTDRLFGIRVCNTDITDQNDQIGWYRQGGAEYTASKEGTTFDNLSGKDGDNMKLKAGIVGKVTFTLTIGNDGMPTALKIAGGVADVVTPADKWVLYTNLEGGDAQEYALNEANNYTWTFTFNATQGDKFVGAKKNNEWRGASNASAYAAVKTDYKMTATNGGNITFDSKLEGVVTFKLDAATEILTVSGGNLKQDTPLPSDDAIIYFYDNDDCGLTTVNAYVWGDNGNNGSYPGVAMTATGKFIEKDGKKYKVWSYTHNGDWTPKNVIINKGEGDDNKLTSGDPVWKNGGFYTHGSTAADNATYTLVDGGTVVPEKPTALYFHIKYDRSEYGKDGKNTVPQAYIYNKNTKEEKTAWNDSPKMTLVEDGIGERYSIWKVDLAPGDAERFNTVIFWFNRKNNEDGTDGGILRYGSDKLRDSGTGEFEFKDYGLYYPNNDKDWTKYIYATSSMNIDVKGDDGKTYNVPKEFAAQSYMTFAEFKALHDADMKRGGREHIYLVGWNAGWYEEDANGEIVGDYNAFPGNVKDGYMDQKAVASDNGCFYLPVAGNGGSFKISWINVNEHAEKCDVRNEKRAWATFDLGLVGVDRDFEKGGWKPNYNRDAGVNGTVWFELNKSVPYMNYNQANWELPKEAGKWYLIVDTHPECKTATITRFNPQPKLEVNYTGIHTAQLTADQAATVHAHSASHKLNSHANTTPVVTMVNFAEAEATLAGMSNAQLSSHKVAWTIKANGQAVGQPVGELGTYAMSYMPISDTGNDITLRGMYKDDKTELTFHTRTATAEMKNSVDLVNPKDIYKKDARYISTSWGEDGNLRYGVYADNLEFALREGTGLNYYFDFEIEDGELAHKGHKYQAGFEGNEYVVFDDFGEKDWSSYVKDNGLFHVILDKNHTEAELVDNTYNGTVKAVYPFLVNPKASLAKKAPRRAAVTGGEVPSVEGLALVHMPATANITIKGDAGKISLGVDNVAVDAEDAEAEYYNLQGVRVYGEPAPGVYVVRKGSKVEKVLVK